MLLSKSLNEDSLDLISYKYLILSLHVNLSSGLGDKLIKHNSENSEIKFVLGKPLLYKNYNNFKKIIEIEYGSHFLYVDNILFITSFLSIPSN